MQLMGSSKPVAVRVVALAAIAAVVLAGSLAFGIGALTTGAQSRDDIRGCVSKYTGALRILSGNQQCSAGERLLSWNQVPAGAVLDRINRERHVVVDYEDETSVVRGDEGCPDGYLAVLGGAIQIHSNDAHPFVLRSSAPVYSVIPRRPVGWQATWVTVDGKPAVGYNEFIVSVVCELRAE